MSDIFKNITPLEESSNLDQRLDWLKSNPHFCKKPFQTNYISHRNGRVISRPCCNFAKDETGPLTKKEKFIDIKNSIKQGKLDSNCKTCQESEKDNVYSERVREMIWYNPKIINNFIKEGKTKSFNLGVEFSNLCNLACRSCDSQHSSLYAKIKNHKKFVEPVDLSNLENSWQDLLLHTEELADRYDQLCIGLIGGETMIQKGAELYLEHVSRLPNAKKIQVSLTTNLTTINTNFFQYIKNIRGFSLTASIDSTGDNYHYVRWPAKFEKIKNNLEEIRQIKKENSNFTPLTIATVFSLNNIFYINEYLDFIEEQISLDPETSINIISLTTPEIISISNLPIRYRPSLLKFLYLAENHKSMELEKLKPLKIWLNETIQFLESSQKDLNQFRSFLKETAKFDKSTNCFFYEFNQRLYSILDGEDKILYKNFLESKIVTY
jgi:organic radical activating enzyme